MGEQQIHNTDAATTTGPKYVPPPVSRWYRNDWQFAVDVSSLPFLRPATLVISAMPALVGVSVLAAMPISPSLWITWAASVCFVLSWAVLHGACPNFIREYRDYGQYLRRHHSHRWVVWEFHANVKSFAVWRDIVKETEAKQLTTDFAILDETTRAAIEREHPAYSQPSADTVRTFTPVNLNRDIYLPIIIDERRLVLALEEDDPKLDAKEKELFWILFTQAAKERPNARIAFWILVYFAGILVAWNVISNVWTVIREPVWQALTTISPQ